MTKILFICHGNICRSPMAEFIMKHMLATRGLSQEVQVESAATSREELGNDIHPGTRKILNQHGISYERRAAWQVQPSDYDRYDYFIAMDEENIWNLNRIFHRDPEHKVSKLLSYAGRKGDVADPWYTHNFDITYQDIMDGLEGLLATLKLF